MAQALFEYLPGIINSVVYGAGIAGFTVGYLAGICRPAEILFLVNRFMPDKDYRRDGHHRLHIRSSLFRILPDDQRIGRRQFLDGQRRLLDGHFWPRTNRRWWGLGWDHPGTATRNRGAVLHAVEVHQVSTAQSRIVP